MANCKKNKKVGKGYGQSFTSHAFLRFCSFFDAQGTFYDALNDIGDLYGLIKRFLLKDVVSSVQGNGTCHHELYRKRSEQDFPSYTELQKKSSSAQFSWPPTKTPTRRRESHHYQETLNMELGRIRVRIYDVTRQQHCSAAAIACSNKMPCYQEHSYFEPISLIFPIRSSQVIIR